MPKPTTSSRKRASRDEYDSDDGFVADAAAPKSKKSKPSEDQQRASKKKNTEMQMDADGSEFWELSNSRRVQVSQFKGNTMIGIREFYTDKNSGKTLPGKKGISLPIDQYATLVQLLPQLERVLKAKGVSVPRPEYAGSSGSAGQQADGGDDDDDEEDDDDNDDAAPDESDEKDDDDDEAPPARKREGKSVAKSSRVKGKGQGKGKGNHEATSEEESD